MAKTRIPFVVRATTKKKLEDLRKEIRKQTGEDISYPDLTDEIVIRANLNDILKVLDNSIKFKLNLDRRKL
jgi:hypothetical protein